jgi:hypothetical protein
MTIKHYFHEGYSKYNVINCQIQSTVIEHRINSIQMEHECDSEENNHTNNR